MALTRRKGVFFSRQNNPSVGISSFSFLIALERVSEGHFTDVNHGLPFAVNFLRPWLVKQHCML